MATVTMYQTAKKDLPLLEEGKITVAFFSITLPSNGINDGDVVNVAVLPAGIRVVGATQKVGATLGTGATVQLRVGSTALCDASTAGSASTKQMNVFPPAASSDGDTINLLVGGANVSASATVDLMVQYVRV